MASLWRHISKLGSAALTVVTKPSLQQNLISCTTTSTSLTQKIVMPCSHLIQTCRYASDARKKHSYVPPSPYKNPGPRRYGYENKMFGGGLLPRPDDDSPILMPVYRPKDRWSRKRALFGQNDYIDILGDGNVQPPDLLHGPDWLVGFNGNEMQRLIRRMRFQGQRLKLLYPTKYHQMRKRIFFLYKKYNHRRRKGHNRSM